MLEAGTVTEWHPLVLPSQGIYYGDKCPGGKVDITPWTLFQEETLVRYQDWEPDLLIQALLANNLRLPNGMKQEELLLTDRHFILVNLRSVSMSPFFSFSVTCPQCGKESVHQADLTQLMVKVPDEGDAEPFVCTLPKSKKKVGLRFLRVSDAIKAKEYGKKAMDVDMGDPETRCRLARQIVSIDDQSVKFEEAMAFIRSLIMLDVHVIKGLLEKKENGYLNAVDVQCGKCTAVTRGVNIPLVSNFFRPLEDDIRAAANLALGDKGGS